jgi:hypothetical protein
MEVKPFGNGRFETAEAALAEAETMTTAEVAQLVLAARTGWGRLRRVLAKLAAENGTVDGC